MKNPYKYYTLQLLKWAGTIILSIICVALIVSLIQMGNAHLQTLDKANEYTVEVVYKWEIAGSTFCRYDLELEGFLSHNHDRSSVTKKLVVVQDCQAFSKGDIFKLEKQ